MRNIEIHSATGESRVSNLHRLLDVVDEGDGRFTGLRKHGGSGRIYGGEVIAQALAAACKTVAANKLVHSLHAYFFARWR